MIKPLQIFKHSSAKPLKFCPRSKKGMLSNQSLKNSLNINLDQKKIREFLNPTFSMRKSYSRCK